MTNDPAAPAQYVPLRDVPALARSMTGVPCSREAVYRWRRSGLRGHRLRCIYLTGGYRTTQEWLAEFFSAVGQSQPEEGRTDA